MPVHSKNKSTDTFRVQYQYAIRLPEQGGGTLGIVLPGVTGGTTVRNQYTWYPAEFTLQPRPPGRGVLYPEAFCKIEELTRNAYPLQNPFTVREHANCQICLTIALQSLLSPRRLILITVLNRNSNPWYQWVWRQEDTR